MTVVEKWVWSRDDPNQNSVSGDITRFFRAEGIEQPGVLGQMPPTERALLFAREAIQNSWDAARELRTKEQHLGIEPFNLTIRYRDYVGAEKQNFVKALALTELADRVASSGETSRNRRDELGLFQDDCLNYLDDLEIPLQMMIFEENRSIGMPGNWANSESRMMFALNRVGYNKKMDGAGGSFGYGKAGLIQASKIRVILAYSCFEEQKNEPGITRRFLGATYWGQHHHLGKSYTGWVRLGEPIEGSAQPLTNELADEYAKSLGLSVRNSGDVNDFGTTFVIVDPDVDAQDLCLAVQRNWWPSLMRDDGLKVQIIGTDDVVLIPDVPRADPELGPFVRAYELQDKEIEISEPEERSKDLGSYRPQNDGREFFLGRLGLVAEIDGWSYPAKDFVVSEVDGSEIEHKSLVALVRGPHMVVQYWAPKRGSAPYVRGVFVADSEVDDLLRQTEPKAHDKWDANVNEPGIDTAAPKVAKVVLERISDELQEFRKTFRPPTPPSGPINLPELDKLMNLLSGTKPPAPAAEKRPFSLSFPIQPEVVAMSKGEVALSATAAFKLSNHVSEDSSLVQLTIELVFVEDSRSGSSCELSISPAHGFTLANENKGKYRFIGVLNKGEQNAEFVIKSNSYSSDWSTKLVISGELLKP